MYDKGGEEGCTVYDEEGRRGVQCMMRRGGGMHSV